MKYYAKCFMLFLGLILWLAPVFFVHLCLYFLILCLPGAFLVGWYWLDVVFRDERFWSDPRVFWMFYIKKLDR